MIDILQAALGPFIAALIALVGVVYTQNQSKKAREQQKALEQKAVDAEAYMRARQIDDSVISRLQSEVGAVQESRTRLEERLNLLREQQRADRERHENEMRAKEIAWANMQDDWRQSLQLHAAWDLLAVQHLQQIDHSLPEPPPLYPPAHSRRRREEESEGGTIEP